jgi:hypothetical protein
MSRERFDYTDAHDNRITLDDPCGPEVTLVIFTQAATGDDPPSVALDAGAVVGLRDACDEWLAERVPWWLTRTEAPS